MKKLFILTFFFYTLSVSINGQTLSRNPSPEEEHAAKNLAVSFFNRFQDTHDISPLIEEFFVKDFAKRLKFCRTTGECEGENKDFWRQREDLAALNTTEIDFQRIYTFSLNNLFLTFRSIQFLNKNYPHEMKTRDYESAAKVFTKELKFQTKNEPQLIKFGFFGDFSKDVGDDGFYSKFNSLNDLHRFLNDYEKYLTVLRLIETKLQINFKKKNPTAKSSFLSTDFRVYVKNNHAQFFNYPKGTKMFEVWGESDSVGFVMNLTEENGKLKIIAVYPPMD